MKFPSPCYILEESKLRRNLELIAGVAKESDTEIILALKAFNLWKTFPIFREYIRHTTASSVNEAQCSSEEFWGRCYTYSPAYDRQNFAKFLKLSEHITFNSLNQFERFKKNLGDWEKKTGQHVSAGIRINPEYSEVETDLYNPCCPGTRFGVLSSQLPEFLPQGIEGFHFHCLCENDSPALANVLKNVEEKFGKWLPQLKWLNMGGGHLMTKKGYNISHLIKTLQDLHLHHPNLKLILEPGSAFLWQTGFLTANVVDIVENHGIKTAILNLSFACHMPDCLEMPYQPEVRDARILKRPSEEKKRAQRVYRLGGNSCLSGDFVGFWEFQKPLVVGQQIILEDMIHYTTVKTNMFNGISHPSIALLQENGILRKLKAFSYKDYKNRMD